MKTTLIIAALLLGGCAEWYSASTKVEVPVIGRDGQLLGIARYESTKDQTDFSAEYDPVTGAVKVSTAKAATAEHAIVESSKATQQALGILGQALKMAPVPGP